MNKYRMSKFYIILNINKLPRLQGNTVCFIIYTVCSIILSILKVRIGRDYFKNQIIILRIPSSLCFLRFSGSRCVRIPAFLFFIKMWETVISETQGVEPLEPPAIRNLKRTRHFLNKGSSENF